MGRLFQFRGHLKSLSFQKNQPHAKKHRKNFFGFLFCPKFLGIWHEGNTDAIWHLCESSKVQILRRIVNFFNQSRMPLKYSSSIGCCYPLGCRCFPPVSLPLIFLPCINEKKIKTIHQHLRQANWMETANMISGMEWTNCCWVWKKPNIKQSEMDADAIESAKNRWVKNGTPTIQIWHWHTYSFCIMDSVGQIRTMFA